MPEKVTLEELSKFKLSPGRLYWSRPSGKETVVLEVGDIMDMNHLEKFERKSHSIKIDWMINLEVVQGGIDLFKRLETAKFEKERESIREEFVLFLKNSFWNGDAGGNLLDLTLMIEAVFNKFEQKQIDYMASLNLDIYKRSTIMASLNIVFSFIVGHMHFDFLKELYCVSFCFDLFDKERPLPLNFVPHFLLDSILRSVT